MIVCLRRVRAWLPRVPGVMALALMLFGAQNTWAACFRASGWTERIINMTLGNITLTENMAVGQVIKSQRFDVPIKGASEVQFRCPGGGTYTGVILQGAPVPGMPNVYSTSIKDIGIRLSRMVTGGPGNLYYPFQLRGTGNRSIIAPAYFVIEVIKTEAVTGSGSLAGGVYTRYYGDGDGLSTLTTYLDVNGISIISPSCSVDPSTRNINVPLGRVPRQGFRGVGSTGGNRQYSIRLNCQAGQNARNTIYLRKDATADASGAQGVLRVKPGTTSAQGLGIRLLDANNVPIRFGQSLYVGPSKDGAYELSYTAQYYQTQNVVRPGQANGIAYFTIDYK